MITVDLEYRIECTKDDCKILKINCDNKWIYVGSKYNMKGEIDKFLEKAINKDQENDIFLIYGFGTGEHIKALRKEFANSKILVFEPNARLKEYIISHEWINKDKNLNILCCEKEILSSILIDYITEYNVNLYNFIGFANYEKIYLKEFVEFLREVRNYIAGVIITRNTKIRYSKRWFHALMDNMKYIVSGSPAEEYKGKYKNKPAVIVSAGPSLEKNIKQLKEVENNMVILSGGRTLRSLLDIEVLPNTLVVVDPAEVSYDLVKGYIENLDRPLLFYEGTNERIVASHKGKKIFNTYMNFVDKICGKKLKRLLTGGSVAHTMASYAVMLGCNPIIFIGQDLAFTNDKGYASVSDNLDGSRSFDKIKREDDIWIEDINGGKVRTSLEFNEFRLYMEKIIMKFPEVTFINATEGGARIQGTIEMPLSEAILKYNNGIVEEVVECNHHNEFKANAIRALEEAIKAGMSIMDKCEEAINYIDKLEEYHRLGKGNKVNSVLNKLNKIDKEIKRSYKKVDLIESLVYPVIYEVLATGNAEDDLDIDKEKMIIEQNKKLYLGILSELKYAIPFIKDAYNKI